MKKKPPVRRAAKRTAKVQYGVFIPMWNEQYAKTLLRSFQDGYHMPPSLRSIAEVRRLPVARRGKA